MMKKKSEEAGAASKVKPSSKDASKKEKFSVSALLANMDEKPVKPKKGKRTPKECISEEIIWEEEVVGDDKTALEAVFSANEELVKLRQDVASLQNLASVEGGVDKDVHYEEDAQVSKILAGLGFTKDMQSRATKSSSGGWRMRISLARALFVQSTLLLLDEPTNHLDLRAVLWLEEYLCRWKKTLVVVSHDRDFLNSVCNEIIHLHDLKLHFYRGNFDGFESGYEQRCKEMNKKFENYEKQMKASKRSGNHVQQEKVKDRAKFVAAKEASKNKGKGKLMRMKPHLRPQLSGGITVLSSTFLNLLSLHLHSCSLLRSQKLRIGRYSRHFVDLLTMDETRVQYLLRLHPKQEGVSKQEAVRAKLGKFGLPSHNHLTPIAKLSGGQKDRVVFTSISMLKPHILLLDEPTNHLDMQSIYALADALDEFTGGVVLVSHDTRLISRVCEDKERSEVWVV
ncbi:ABC transporter-like protein [Quillaja saponaria]|uniref:ABC transporter-like protein n=1 Tax=Quillaja saponaria TaxID=32244 RepID=A0AAD7KVE0_QUISA|nr:ABC transporter-like protein [Quillaja saponaria]